MHGLITVLLGYMIVGSLLSVLAEHLGYKMYGESIFFRKGKVLGFMLIVTMLFAWPVVLIVGIKEITKKRK